MDILETTKALRYAGYAPGNTPTPHPFFELDHHSFYRTLLESTRAIPWCINWATKEFSYIGPQIEEVLGWPTNSWKTVNDWAERIHPGDREFSVNFCVAQAQDGMDHELDYRAMTKAGRYVWIRDVVHVMRDSSGAVQALVGFMFDITDRKLTEQKLQEMHRQVEELSLTDELTGLPNRRRFQRNLELEWASAIRFGLPLSLIMIDIDFFKSYNDTFGHVAGDECLRQVGQLLKQAAAHRPKDLIVRFGGEEFAVILPETDLKGAREVAERLRKAITAAAIPHPNSSVAEHLTISLGIDCILPTQEDNCAQFVDLVDQQLYQAKHRGRNQAGCRHDA